jgi:hypothetical protein
MFVLPLKTGPRVDVRSALIAWLDDPVDPSTDARHNPLDFILPKPKYRSSQIAGELMRLQSLRNDLLLSLPKPSAHAHALANRGLEDAMEYHATLLAFERQGFTSDRCCASMIPYNGAFATAQSEAHGSLVWDRAVTVYNIAALLMYRAANTDTHDREGCKQCIAHCQQAAYLLETCKDLCSTMTQFTTVDLSGPLLTVAASSCLAYAQACVCKMISTSSDSTSPPPNKNTLSVLLQATHTLYNTVLEQAQDPRLQSDIPKPSADLATEAKLHSMVYAIRARWVQSQTFRESYRYGDEIAVLSTCYEQCQALQSYLDETSGRSPALATPLATAAIREYKTLAPQVFDRLEEVVADNRSTYHEVVPNTPPPLVGKQLAKPAAALPPAMLEPIQPLFLALSLAQVAL